MRLGRSCVACFFPADSSAAGKPSEFRPCAKSQEEGESESSGVKRILLAPHMQSLQPFTSAGCYNVQNVLQATDRKTEMHSCSAVRVCASKGFSPKFASHACRNKTSNVWVQELVNVCAQDIFLQKLLKNNIGTFYKKPLTKFDKRLH